MFAGGENMLIVIRIYSEQFKTDAVTLVESGMAVMKPFFRNS